MILKGYPRISETFISNEILLLEQLGFSIHLFSMRQPREIFSHESVNHIKASVDYLPETLLVPLPKLLYHNFLLAPKNPHRYKTAVKTALRRFSRTRKSATIKHLLQAGYMVQHLLQDKNVKHLHAHFAHSPTSVALFASQMSGIPFSFTAHAKDIYTQDARQLREKIALARFVVTCTEYNRHHLQAIYNKGITPVYRIYHGFDTDVFSWRKKKKKTSPPFAILTVARLTEKKGLPTVYRALRQVHDQGFAIRHVLIGDGEDRQQVLSLIKDLGLNQITTWLGTQPHEVVLNHYRQADLFVLGCEVASNGDRDGIPNVFLECMAMGVPVVSTKVSAIPELIQNEKTGLLVPPGSPEEMAQAMVRLLTDSDLRKNIITSAKQRVLKDFDNKKLIGDLAKLFDSSLTSDQ
ncbi:MAG: glycosyltransferase family 4 protein [Desulfobacterales bacterium]|nr:MAG: glycosyltransferase family 4 protein [Desulfobacterales bacterium]UCD91353.1 MAG: glycosyltransferase family 4 protein [Desulfobacterales bacterium]